MSVNPYEFYRHRNEIADMKKEFDAMREDMEKRDMKSLEEDLFKLYVSMCSMFGSYFRGR